MEVEEKDKEIAKTDIACLSKKRAEIDETAHLKKYIMWENKSNICWLDASMALIAHNKVMKRASQVSPNSGISKIIASYAEAISIINNLEKSSISWPDILNLAKSKLNCVQESTLQYLQPILKYKPGDPDSAFCSLYNLLKEDSVIKGIFDVTWISIKICTNCDKNTENTKTKPLITLSKIDSFDPKSPTVLYNCNCDKSEQKIRFVFLTLPPCLIFHFENGAGHEKPPLTFVTQERQYYLTGIMTLEKGQESNVNHFITWVRDPFADKWLDCNDLNPDIVYFTSDFPDIRFEDVSFYVYESFDDLGTIRLQKSNDYKKLNSKNSEDDIVLIDISEESGSENSNSVSNACGADINVETHEVPSANSQVTIFTTEIDSSKSQEETSAGDKEHVSDKEIVQADSALSSETPCNEIKDSEDKNATESIKKASPDQVTDQNIQDEKTNGNGFQDLRISDDKAGKEASKRVIQPDNDNKSSLEASKLNNQIISCSDQKQTDNEGIFSLCEEKNLENTVAIEKPKGIKVKDEQNIALLPANELHISEEGDKITKADMEKSGTSYVKLSFRRKKHPGLTFLQKNYVKNDNKPASDETKTASVRKSPRSVTEMKYLKRNRDEEWDIMPQKRPRKNQKFGKVLEGLQSNANKEDISHLVHNKEPTLSLQDKSNIEKNIVGKKKIQQINKISELTPNNFKSPKERNKVFINQPPYSSMFSATENFMLNEDPSLSLQDKSKIKTISKKKIQQKPNISLLTSKDNKSPNVHNRVLTNRQTCSRMFSATKNSNKNDCDEGKVLKEFEDVWSCHAAGCSCEQASLEETIDTVVDYTFAYLCKLSQELKKANVH